MEQNEKYRFLPASEKQMIHHYPKLKKQQAIDATPAAFDLCRPRFEHNADHVTRT